ncbi:MAG: GNAT family N-acetyltransferase [Alphaproteobacteria bacterium]|nr:MAG: GNAT family N-acetyltransferase [Alphaproteobacteria bacterium]
MLAKAGNLEVRLGSSPQDIEKCQRLRYEVFYEEMAAKPIGDMGKLRLDFDKFDAIADHLIVRDLATPGGPTVVGTYRLIRREVAEANGGFYTAGEYDIAPMIERAGPDMNFVELGRSCVHKDYRNRPTINLLWQGLGQYVNRYNVGAFFGCASFPGTDPAALKLPLSFLHHHLSLPEEFQVRALPHLYNEMNLMPKEEINERAALRTLPPLIRGYVMAGCLFGTGAVIDEQFSTVDVFVMSIIQRASERYMGRFAAKT